jgi:Flp pilus assembly protein TadG
VKIMLLARRPHRRCRKGMTIVEATLVLSVFLMLLFGIFEYCRFLMVLHLTNNAARDGARYAVVNSNRPSNFDTVDYTDAAGTVYPSITKYTTARMGSMEKMIFSYQVEVFACDMTTMNASPPVVQPKSGGVWNQTLFGEKIAVRITGKYRPITPVLLMMPSEVDIKAVAVMGCEG